MREHKTSRSPAASQPRNLMPLLLCSLILTTYLFNKVSTPSPGLEVEDPSRRFPLRARRIRSELHQDAAKIPFRES